MKHNWRYIEEIREMAENELCMYGLDSLFIYKSFFKNRKQNLYITTQLYEEEPCCAAVPGIITFMKNRQYSNMR